MKAEPESRIVKGKDVKVRWRLWSFSERHRGLYMPLQFSVDDFEAVKTTAWEGVRNAEARNLMKEMAVGDQVLFYHSNCKTPGIAAIAEVRTNSCVCSSFVLNTIQGVKRSIS